MGRTFQMEQLLLVNYVINSEGEKKADSQLVVLKTSSQVSDEGKEQSAIKTPETGESKLLLTLLDTSK